MTEREKIEQQHSFSDTLARQHGIKEAIVLKFLAYKVRRSSKVREGRKWHYDTTEALAKRFPYIPRSTLDGVLKRMGEKGLISIGNFNKKPYDRTRWYSVPDNYLDPADEDPRYFDADIATAQGIPEALVYQNLAHWSTTRFKAGDDIWQPMIPSYLKTKLPLSESTIRRALAKLCSSGLIVRRKGPGSLYATVNIARSAYHKNLKLRTREENAKAKEYDSIVEPTCSGSARPLSKSDNNTH